MTWTVVVSAGPAALGTVPAQRPVPSVPQAQVRTAAAPVFTVTAAPPPPPTTPPVTTTTPVAESAPKPTTATVGGTTVKVAAVGVAANGLPRANGLWSRAGRPVLRLSTALVGSGSTVTITHPDGSTDAYGVTSRTTLSTAEAAQAVAGAASGELVMVASAGDGSWIVVTAA